MLERLISAEEIEKKPWKIIILGVIYSSFALVTAYLIFPSEADISMIFLATILCMPLLHRFVVLEQDVFVTRTPKRRLNFISVIKEQLHPRLISLFSILFIVFIIVFTAWYVFLPENIANALFNVQKQTIIAVNQHVMGVTGQATGSAVGEDVFSIILLNNVKVLLFSFVLSFLFGAGAIFVLTWNTSVIAVAIGELLIKNVYRYGSSAKAATKAFARYLLHGIPELISYLVAIFAGVFISIGVIRFPIRSKEFVRLLITSLNLIVFSLIILVIAAILEVYISPLII